MSNQTDENQPGLNGTRESMTEPNQPTVPAVQKKKMPVISLLVFLAFAGMVTVNALASLLPINGEDTGAISDSYPNLFAPAGITFAIWGLIYLLLALFTVFQFFRPDTEMARQRLIRIQMIFIISSLANIAWIFAWHYRQIGLSLILMAIILICLILVDRQVSRQSLSLQEKLSLRLPFSIYFGWISVATVANVTTLLVDLGWAVPVMSESLWMVIILAVATLIALAVITSRRNWLFGAVFVWAYAGILIKHLDPVVGFGGRYIAVIITVSVCLGLIAASSFLTLIGRSVKLSATEKDQQAD